MPKRTLFTNITPLPPQVSREVAIAMLHNHDEMIELNPLVIEHHPIKTPRDAPAEEFLDCVWQELTDRIHYLPGGMVKGKVSYRACFHDLPNGLQTHIYAPMGLDIREKWTVGGSLPGEPPEARELGLNVPRQGLYLREEGDMRCNMMLTSFVRKNLDNAHKVLVERILKKAERVEEHLSLIGASSISSGSRTNSFQPGSHMSQSSFINSMPSPGPQTPTQQSFQPSQLQEMHPALRNDPIAQEEYRRSIALPPYSAGQSFYSPDVKQQIPPQQPVSQQPKQFLAELEGSSLPQSTSAKAHVIPDTTLRTQYRQSSASELSGSDERHHSRDAASSSARDSMISELHADQYQYQHQYQHRQSSYDNSVDEHRSNKESDRYSYISELTTPPAHQQQFPQHPQTEQ